MRTLSYRDKDTGNLVNLYVSEENYSKSNHQRLTCITCHEKGFDKYPHTEEAISTSLLCLDCHKTDEKLKPYNFPNIEKEFKNSVHVERLADKFSCFSCHDPHEFLTSRTALFSSELNTTTLRPRKMSTTDAWFEHTEVRPEILHIVEYDNRICLNCHNSSVIMNKLDPDDPPNFMTAHDWLPNSKLHWKKVRCIDCHLGRDNIMSHNILSADKALNDCKSCHSRDSILLTKLYLYSKTENQLKHGFINSAIMNDSYIIGMNRNLLLEKWSFYIFGFTLIGILLHIIGRYMSRYRAHRK